MQTSWKIRFYHYVVIILAFSVVLYSFKYPKKDGLFDPANVVVNINSITQLSNSGLVDTKKPHDQRTPRISRSFSLTSNIYINRKSYDQVPFKLPVLPVPKVTFLTENHMSSTFALNMSFDASIVRGLNTTDTSHFMSLLERFAEKMPIFDNADYFIKSIELVCTNGTLNKKIYELMRQYSIFDSVSGLFETSSNSEAYIIEFSDSGIVNVVVNSISGAHYSLASLSQLLSSSYPLPSPPFAIVDWPFNHWRGLLLDVSRHYFPVALIKRCIDAMEIAKFNVLHLHLTDSQSFPVLLDDVEDLPLSQLARRGSHSDDKIYTKSDLSLLVQYAFERGIDIVPEIDMPAHSLSWGRSFPSIVVNCSKRASVAETPHNIYALNPIDPLTLKVVRNILIQLVSIFPSSYFHIGGDEVDIQCWEESETIRNISRFKHESMTDLFRHFESKVIKIVRDLGKTPMVWQGVIDANILEDADPFASNNSSAAIVQPWKCWSGLAVRAAVQAVKSHHPVVMSACWYLDYDSDWTNLLAVDLIANSISDVQHSYSIPRNPISFNISNNRHSNSELESSMHSRSSEYVHENYFFGGEGAMWTEHVDISNLECRMWPRSLAIATRLWGYEINQPLQLFSSTMNISTNRNDSISLELRRSLETFDTDFPRKIDNVNAKHYSVLHSSASSLSTYMETHRQLSSITLGENETLSLFHSYIHTRFFLVKYLDVKAADIIFHWAVEGNHRHGSIASASASAEGELRRRGGVIGSSRHQPSRRLSTSFLYPAVMKDEELALKELEKVHYRMPLSSLGPPIGVPQGNMVITSRCLGIPENIQRAVSQQRIKVAQLNVANGSLGKRGDLMLQWLQDLAISGTLFAGFCELNGWQELQSHTELYKNLPKIAFRSANAGFAFSHVMVNSQPYNLGIVSSIPFTVVKEWGPPNFQRGVLHVFYDNLNLDVFIVHLHAHSSILRREECLKIVAMAESIRRAHPSRRFLLMGDFNSLSPWDQKEHSRARLAYQISKGSHPVYKRFTKKYLDNSNNKIDYEPVESLLRNGLFRDFCVESCRQELLAKQDKDVIQDIYHCLDSNERDCFGALKGLNSLWTLKDQDLFSLCMQNRCPFTEPTLFNPEWNEQEIGQSHPKIRLDFILGSPNLFFNSHSLGCVDSYVNISSITQVISDHFPVVASFPYKVGTERQSNLVCVNSSEESFTLY